MQVKTEIMEVLHLEPLFHVKFELQEALYGLQPKSFNVKQTEQCQRQEEHGSSLLHMPFLRWKTDIKFILLYKFSPQCCFISHLFSAWIFYPMSLLPIFQYPHTMDSLFTFLISFSSMRFFLLTWLRSEGSQCHIQWIPNLSSGFPGHLIQGSTGILLLWLGLLPSFLPSFFQQWLVCSSFRSRWRRRSGSDRWI